MLGLRTDLVHDMSELVEISLHLGVIQQRWFIRSRSGEVTEHGADNGLSVPRMQQTPWLQPKHCSVPVLPFPGVQVDVELTEEGVGRCIENRVELGICVPGGCVLDFNELQIEDFLVDLEETFSYFLKGEVFFELFCVY